MLPRDRKTKAPLHTRQRVYSEMLMQICHDYGSLPDARTLRDREIRFFYDGLRADLRAQTKPAT